MTEPVDEETFYATVAERAGLSRSEAAYLTRATLDSIAGQIAGGELDRLAMDPTHLDHALSLLPAEYRRLATG